MADEKNEPVYAKPASQVDLEARLDNDNRSDKILSTSDQYVGPVEGDGRTYAVEDNDLSGYVGVSSEYATYANETEAPLEADESPENKILANFAKQMSGLTQASASEEEVSAAQTEATSTAQTTAAKSAAGSTTDKAAQTGTTDSTTKSTSK